MQKKLFVTEEQYKANLEVISNFNGQVGIIPEDDVECKEHLSGLGIKSLPIIILIPKGRDNCLNLIKTYGKLSDGNDIKIEL